VNPSTVYCETIASLTEQNSQLLTQYRDLYSRYTGRFETILWGVQVGTTLYNIFLVVAILATVTAATIFSYCQLRGLKALEASPLMRSQGLCKKLKTSNTAKDRAMDALAQDRRDRKEDYYNA